MKPIRPWCGGLVLMLCAVTLGCGSQPTPENPGQAASVPSGGSASATATGTPPNTVSGKGVPQVRPGMAGVPVGVPEDRKK